MAMKKAHGHVDLDLIPEFDPDKKQSNVKKWLNNIDQLSHVYAWSDYDRIFVMKSRLRGAAIEWLEGLKNPPSTWEHWKDILISAFKRPYDYVDRLHNMLARNKSNDETMMSYFDDKMFLIKKCALKGKAALACVIRGLPIELQLDAESYDFETPDELYNNYLSTMENFKAIKTNKQLSWQHTARKTCNYCQKTGHYSSECRFNRCQLCRRFGHDTKACWYGPPPGFPGTRSQVDWDPCPMPAGNSKTSGATKPHN
ncbi:unnamed protein product [Chrysodeixis includens]|uniref:CCHC-type domain-containing protein n=1 Tax=Chrysodeixis includens TaxID=689277 RepID=A0A9P0FRQ3_CHRIL|nr:unnamed protein product [Chrysodeixis includens]